MSTSDLYDEHGASAQTCETQFRSFGAVPAFSGPIATVRCLEDNVLVKQRVSEPGGGRVLVVDGAGSFRCALVGDNVAGTALANGWAGLVLNCCVRDSAALAGLGLGIFAIGTNPRPSGKTGAGEVDVPVTFGGCTFAPGALLHADGDGIVVVPSE
ncbi:MAG TPA: ribonuclease E activity regulator RraA [Gaiellaceae bacterium]|jgi:regulator of ribonuclease activity A|nr:ribonuclease E activity regulator RraA [Gaiellaceae bacterium]